MDDLNPRWASLARLARAVGPVVGLIALTVLLMSPMLETGYLSDDTVTSTTPGMLVCTGWTLGGRIFDTIQWSMKEGRFYPLHWVAFSGVFALIRDVFSYKIYILSLVVLDVILFHALARRLFGDARSALVAASVAVILMQFRAYHDPILSFFGLLQIVAALTILALLMLLRRLDGGGRAWLYGGATLYLAAMLLYEASYPFALLFIAVIGVRFRDRRARLAASLPYLIALGACVGASLLVRWSSSGGEGSQYHYAMNLAPPAVVSAVLRQVSGALPLSYFVADPAGLFAQFQGVGATLRMILRPDVLAVLALSASMGFFGLARTSRMAQVTRAEGMTPWVVGLSLAILPAITIALTVRYQGEIGWGKPYIPVYVQYFGVAVLLVAAARAAARALPPGRAATGLRLALAATLAIASAVTYRANVATVASLVAQPGSPDYNQDAYCMAGAWHHDRINLEAAMRAGLLDPVPPRARLLPDHGLDLLADGIYFYAMHTGKVFETIAPNHAAGAPPTSAPAFALREVTLSPTAGYAFLTRADGGPEARLFLRMPGLISRGLPPQFLVSGSTQDAPYLKHLRDLPILRSGPDWAVFSLDSVARQVRPETLKLALTSAEISRVVARAMPPGPHLLR